MFEQEFRCTNTKQKVEKQRDLGKHSCLKDYRRDPEDRPEWGCAWETVIVSRREEATSFISVLLKNKKGFFLIYSTQIY